MLRYVGLIHLMKMCKCCWYQWNYFSWAIESDIFSFETQCWCRKALSTDRFSSTLAFTVRSTPTASSKAIACAIWCKSSDLETLQSECPFAMRFCKLRMDRTSCICMQQDERGVVFSIFWWTRELFAFQGQNWMTITCDECEHGLRLSKVSYRLNAFVLCVQCLPKIVWKIIVPSKKAKRVCNATFRLHKFHFQRFFFAFLFSF